MITEQRKWLEGVYTSRTQSLETLPPEIFLHVIFIVELLGTWLRCQFNEMTCGDISAGWFSGRRDNLSHWAAASFHLTGGHRIGPLSSPCYHFVRSRWWSSVWRDWPLARENVQFVPRFEWDCRNVVRPESADWDSGTRSEYAVCAISHRREITEWGELM